MKININQNLPIFYLITFFLVFIVLAISPKYRYMWFIENIIIIITILILICTYKKFRFTNLSYTLFFIYAIIVEIGAHYTYAEVPIHFLVNLFDWQRNHFDRIVHFSYGFLLAIPFSEIFQKTSKIKSNFWIFLVPILIIFTTGAIYEIIECMFAVLSNPNASEAFLGSQGDVWDAQKDMFFAGVGACLSMVIYYIFKNKVTQKDS
ncbi:MAG: DUF2238 domain-containing protein [Nanoarchaeota archaeon]